MRFTAVLVVAGLALSRPLYAGCEKDTDCKGARVCENGVCVGEAPKEEETPEPQPQPKPEPRRVPERPAISLDAGKAKRRAIASLVLAPLAIVGAAVSAGLGVAAHDDDDIWFSVPIDHVVTLAFAASAYGTGLHGSLIARRGLEQPRGSALLITGMTVGGVGMLGLLATTTIAFFAKDDNDASLVAGWLGGLAGVLAGTGGILLGVDALSAAKSLAAETQAKETTADVWILPMATRDGAGIQAMARF